MVVGSVMEIRLGRESAMGKAVTRQNLAGRRRLTEVDRNGLGKAVRWELTVLGILHLPFGARTKYYINTIYEMQSTYPHLLRIWNQIAVL